MRSVQVGVDRVRQLISPQVLNGETEGASCWEERNWLKAVGAGGF